MTVKNNKKIIPFLLFVVFSLFAGASYADADPRRGPPETLEDTATRITLCALLRTGDYDDLNAKTEEIQEDYESGSISDVSLMHIFRTFCDTDHTLTSRYTAWLAAYPYSYTAHLAYGIYLRDMAYEARGNASKSETPPERLAKMNQYANLSANQLSASLPLTGKPMISYHAMLGLARIQGNLELARKIQDAACSVDPKNFIVRLKYFTSLHTTFGGSLQAMIKYRQEVQQAGLPKEQLAYFDEDIAAEALWLQRYGAQTDKMRM